MVTLMKLRVTIRFDVVSNLEPSDLQGRISTFAAMLESAHPAVTSVLEMVKAHKLTGVTVDVKREGEHGF